MEKSRVKRARSPRHADNVPRRWGSGGQRRDDPDHRSASDARRIAELEAEVKELRGKMAALEAVIGVDLHDSDEVRALRAAQRSAGATGFGSFHVEYESRHRTARAILQAVCHETQRLATASFKSVNPKAFAQWTMPHVSVPSLVAEHVVAPFVAPDWVVSGPGAPRTAVFKARDIHDACRTIDELADEEVFGDISWREGVPSFDTLCQMTCGWLSGNSLRRFLEVITPFASDWPSLAFLRHWCDFRLAMPSERHVAAAAVFASASHAAEWRGTLTTDTPTSQEVLEDLAAFVASPAQLIALCSFPLRGEDEVPVSFWTNFFCRLAPHATTTAVVHSLCDALITCKFEDRSLDDQSVQRFFVTLVPAITSACALRRVVQALRLLYTSREPGSFRQDDPFPRDFYRLFFLPLARSATCVGMVSELCNVFTEMHCELWSVGTEFLPVLNKFLDIVTGCADGSVRSGAISLFVDTIILVAHEDSMTALANGMIDSVLSPLVRLVSTDQVLSHRLDFALKVTVASRVEVGDVSGAQKFMI